MRNHNHNPFTRPPLTNYEMAIFEAQLKRASDLAEENDKHISEWSVEECKKWLENEINNNTNQELVAKYKRINEILDNVSNIGGNTNVN